MAKSTFAKTAASTKTAAPRKSRAKKTAEVVTLNSAEVIDPEFADLYEILGGAPAAEVVADSAPVAAAAADEIVAAPVSDEVDDLAEIDALLAPEVAPATAPELSLDDLETAVTRAEATEAMLAAATTEEVVEGAAPTGDAADVEPAKAKRAAPTRKHYADKIERLKDRVGAALPEYAVLTAADAVDEAALGEVVERTLGIIRNMNSKEKNRASNFIEFLSGKKAKLNEVLERVLRVLDRDGFLTTGNEGNVMKDLIARPYSPASARAMGGNTIGMYADLKVIIPDGKGRFVANPDSLLLAKARALLGAAPVTAAGPVIDPTPEVAAPVAAEPVKADKSEVHIKDLVAATSAEFAAVDAAPF